MVVPFPHRGGADGAIAGLAVMAAPGDGYTLLFVTAAGLNAVPVMLRQPPFDPVSAFAPISLVGRLGFLLFGHQSVAARDVSMPMDVVDRIAREMNVMASRPDVNPERD